MGALHTQVVPVTRVWLTLQLAEVPWATALSDTALDAQTRERIVSMAQAAQSQLETHSALVSAHCMFHSVVSFRCCCAWCRVVLFYACCDLARV